MDFMHDVAIIFISGLSFYISYASEIPLKLHRHVVQNVVFIGEFGFFMAYAN